MKKLLTLCLAAVCCLSIGAFAATAFSGASGVAAANEEKPATLTREITEAYTFTKDDMTDKTPALDTPAVQAWVDTLKMSKFSKTFSTSDSKFYVGFEGVSASEYSFVTFRTHIWGSDPKTLHNYVATEVYTAQNVPANYTVMVDKTYVSSGFPIEENVVSIPTSLLKDGNGMVSGLIIKNPTVDGISGWFMVSDVTFTDEARIVLDYSASSGSQGETTGIVVQQDAWAKTAPGWQTEALRNRVELKSRTAAFDVTIKFPTPLSASEVDYFSLKMLGWDDAATVGCTIKNLDGTKIADKNVYFNWNTDSELEQQFFAAGLANSAGKIEGFIISSPNGATNFLFSDIKAVKGFPEVIGIDFQKSSSTAGYYQKNNWAGIEIWDKNGLLFNGRNLENGTLTTVFKLPVDVSVYKTIDFDALIWSAGGTKRVQIEKLDGTKTEIVKMVSGSVEEEVKNLGVKINAELLADENGFVEGFKMTILDDNKDGHLVFSEMKGGTTEKEYSIIFRAEGAEDIAVSFTKSTIDSVSAPKVPYKEHYDGEWEAFTVELEEGKIVNAVYVPTNYSAIFMADDKVVAKIEYNVENVDKVEIPAVPEKERYQGVWEDFELEFGYGQVINAVYTPAQYKITFKADDKVVGTVNYSAETADKITAPAVPEKERYENGAWEEFTPAFNDTQVVNAVYTAIVYKATFKAEGKLVKELEYTVENKDDVTAPAVPEKEHYKGEWEKFELDFAADKEVNAVYTAIVYKVTFKAEGNTVKEIEYTAENKDGVTAPAVPEKEGYTGKWENYELNYGENQVVNAVYEKIGEPDTPDKPEDPKPEKGGCKSEFIGAPAIILIVAAAFALVIKLKRKRG